MRLALAALFAAAAPAFAADSDTLYALGAKLAQDYMLGPADAKTVAEGLSDAAAGKKLKAEPKDLRVKLAALESEAAEARRKAVLDAYAKEPGAKRFPSGLIFKELKAGAGKKPSATSTVKVHYHGTFPDGAVFDSSVQRGETIEFPLNGVIKCWTEGVQMIAEGGKARLVCPHEIAYGPMGRPGIPPKATLVFEVELFEVK